jgi:hypothetical protein
MSPLEVGWGIADLMDELGSLDQASRVVNLDPTTVRRFVSLTRLAPQVQPLVGWGTTRSTLSFSAAAELSRLSGQEQVEAAKAALENRMTKEELRQVVQLRSRTRAPITECVAQALRTRPEVQYIHVFLGSTGDDHAVQSFLAGLEQSERDELFREALEALIGTGATGRLTEYGFSVVTYRELGAKEAASIEGKLQSFLKERAA